MSAAKPSSVPSEEGADKKKKPHRKAPSAPKKKKRKDDDKEKDTLSLPKDSSVSSVSDAEGKVNKSLTRSISPRKEQYSSLLDEMVGKGDMVLLDPITDDTIIENLKKRYTAEEIYVCLQEMDMSPYYLPPPPPPLTSDLHRPCGGLNQPLSAYGHLHGRACGGISK